MRRAALVMSVGLTMLSAWGAARPKPPNLARKAKATASSEYSRDYRAKLAIDGVIPGLLTQDDVGKAWAVHGATARDRATFTLEWPQPVKVAEIIYYARMAWLVGECWKDYEVRLDDQAKPVAKGRFKQVAGPQRIKVPPGMVRKITFKFLSSYGGLNPGAAEIEVYAQSPPADALPKVVKAPRQPPPGGQWELPEESKELAQLVRDHKLGFDKLLLIERHELNPSHVYTACCEGFRAGGGLYLLSPPAPEGELKQLVASPQGQIMDCDVSYDGKEIIFSWRKTPRDGYHIFRMNADGTGLTQLTDGPYHDYNACWLPDGGIAFISTRGRVVPLCWVTPAGVLYRMERDGSKLRRLSANYVNDFTPSVFSDGRILYSRWEYVDKPAIPIQSMWTIRPDGTGLSVFYGNGVLSPASFLEAQAIPGTTEVLCTLTAHNGPIRGGLGVIDRNQGLDAQDAICNLTPQINIGTVYRGSGNHVRGPFEGPYPLDAERFLVSHKGTILFGDRSEQWAIVRPRGGSLGYWNPRPVRPRPRPPALASALGAEPQGEATVFLLDVYDGLEPHVQRGTVTQIAVVQELAKSLRTHVLGFGFQRPVISCGATYAPKKVWGYVPVEPDGSAHFRVPAGIPIYFLALDATGQAVQRMRSFTHLMPGERQGCIGCHEPRNQAPMLRQAAAVGRPPSKLQPPEWGVEGFDYAKMVQPVFDRHCTKCHSGPAPPKRIDLTGGRTDWFNVSYDVLTRGYVNWIDTRNGRERNILQITPKAWGSPASKLTKILLSGHPDKDGKPRFQMDEASRRRIFAWIDLNIPYYATYEMVNTNAEGGRRIYPRALNGLLAGVAKRRCASCHRGRPPSRGFLRLSEPEMNDFLLAPLAKSAGGRQSCGKAIFADKSDPDYQALLKCLEPTRQMLASPVRMDIPGAKPGKANRSCQ